MKKLLVFGGTRFFGKKVVAYFLTEGYEITLATRGVTPDDFGTKVKRVVLDRTDSTHPGWQLIQETNWDIVFDNLCYTWQDAKIALDHLQAVSHYLVTSSLAVYEGDSPITGFKETDFKPEAYQYIVTDEVSYGEGKRQTEAYFKAHAPFPVSFLRFPVVLDNDDYTERLHFYIRKALHNESIIFKRTDGDFNFIKGSEIPLALAHIIKKDLTGPINISSKNPFSTEQFVAALTKATQKEIKVEIATENISPFSHYDSTLDVGLLEESGYPTTPLASWLPDLMATLVLSEKR